MAHGPVAQADDGVVDNTTCTVLNSDDTVDSFNSLRRKVEEGWNRSGDQIRACTQLINFSNVSSIVLKDPLSFSNQNALDCEAGPDKPQVCGDGWALVVDGSPKVTLDVTGIDANTCAITLDGNRIKLKNITITATADQIKNDKVICDKGKYNDISDVTINGEHPHPSPLPSPKPSPLPSPKPSPLPSPQPSPLPSPLPSPEPSESPVASATPVASPEASPSPSPEPIPPQTPEASSGPTPVNTHAPPTSPSPSTSGDTSSGGSFLGCDGGNGGGCSLVTTDTSLNFWIYFSAPVFLLKAAALRRKHKRDKSQ